MKNIFPSAVEARNSQSLVDVVVFDEIRAIERAVLIANATSLLEATVMDTTMTTDGSALSEDYWKVYSNIVEDRSKKAQMDGVVTYFTDRKYSITRRSNNRLTVSAAMVVDAGTGYAPNDLLTIVGGLFTVAAQLTVATTQVVSVNINAAGTGYSVGDLITIGTGVGTPAVLEVSAVLAGGVVDTLTITNNGEYSTNPTLLGSSTTTNGSGIGLQLGPIMGVKTVTISEAGSYGTLPTDPVSTTGGTNEATFNLSAGTLMGATFYWWIRW